MKLTHITTLSLVAVMTATAPALAVLNTPANGRTVFNHDGNVNDNPAPGNNHPSLPGSGKRSEKGDTSSGDNVGAWEAHKNSGGVIDGEPDE